MSVKETQVLNGLKTQLELLKQEKHQLNNHINSLKQKIKKLETETIAPTIPEHAYLIYFEGVLGYDLEKLGKEILTPDILQQIQTLGPSGTYPNKE